MKKSTIMKLGVGIFAVVLASGCITGGGQSDEELVAALMETWKAALLAQDLDAFMALLSEDFTGGDIPDKDSMREIMEMMMVQGAFDDATVDLETAETTIEGDTATVYPVELEWAVGPMSLELILTKEEGGWMITSLIGG